MLAVGMSLEQAQEILGPYSEVVSVAAVNSPSSLTLSGPTDVLKTIAAELERRGIFGRMLRVNYAFHSPGLEPVRDELLQALEGVTPRPTTLPLYSTVTGRIIAGTELDAEYWWRNLRQPVLFADAIKSLDRRQSAGGVSGSRSPSGPCRSHERVLRIAWRFPRPLFPRYGATKRNAPTMLRGLGELYTLGYPVAWKSFSRPRSLRSRCRLTPGSASATGMSPKKCARCASDFWTTPCSGIA